MIHLRNSKTNEEVFVAERPDGAYPESDGWHVTKPQSARPRLGAVRVNGKLRIDREEHRKARIRGMTEVERFDILSQRIEELMGRIETLENERAASSTGQRD